MTKKEIIERMSAIARTEQDAIASTAEEREAEYKNLLLEVIREDTDKAIRRAIRKHHNK